MDALEEARDLAYEAAQHMEATQYDSDDSTITDTDQKTKKKKKKKKRSLAEIMAEIPDPMTVIFDPLPVPTKRAPILHLLSSTNTDDAFALFSLF